MTSGRPARRAASMARCGPFSGVDPAEPDRVERVDDGVGEDTTGVLPPIEPAAGCDDRGAQIEAGFQPARVGAEAVAAEDGSAGSVPIAGRAIAQQPARGFSTQVPVSSAAHVRLSSGDVAVVGTMRPSDVGLGPHPFDHMWVVQLESWSLRTDPGQLSEVVPRRRASRWQR
jgi:hypothetical protein